VKAGTCFASLQAREIFMSLKKNKKKLVILTVAGFFAVTGIYNSVVINSQSYLDSDIKFVKRLDEVYGVTIPGRKIATTTTWKKLSRSQSNYAKSVKPIFANPAPSQSFSAASENGSQERVQEAVVQEELNLNLIEVINPKKWKDGLKPTDFSGSIATNNGVIESLSVSLPNSEGVSVSFSEMTGNVFEYDLNGELYSGMMYQVDQHAYMVTLTNGPLEGTQLRFTSELTKEEQQSEKQFLADNNVQVGSFGSEAALTEVSQQPTRDGEIEADQLMQQEAIQAQGYNLDQPQEI
jgi:hypothetical protein